ncbi:hypothetical protein AB1Y20_020612 [Prymnesium parvum]|uniref:Methyltransferase FkbM domain-containing protein n=1 Tax=Prymnesium parvum TaxID=97485 RepID=A0AB34JVN9_PRYPA
MRARCVLLFFFPQLATASQDAQAYVLDHLFQLIGTTNKEYVEFGYNTNLLCGGSGANTCRLHQQGWRGLLLDGGHQNTSINLHREMISSANIVHLFRKYGVSTDVDYVSMDMDSCDLWVLESLLSSKYSPRVITAEFNTNIPWPHAITFPDKAKFDVHYKTDRVHYGLNGEDKPAYHGCYVGASAGAFDIVARDHGYEIVAVVFPLDLVLVRLDVMQGVRSSVENSTELYPYLFRNPQNQRKLRRTVQLNTWGNRAMTIEQARELVDYRVWRETILTGSATMSEAVSAGREAALKQVAGFANGKINCFAKLRGRLKQGVRAL